MSRNNLVHKIFTMPQAMKIPDAKAVVKRNGRSSRQFQPGTWKRLEQEGGYSGSTKGQKKVHFASLMDICHLTKAELEPKEQKYQGRVVLRGDIVKDNSEAYAVFTEQGSSSSHFMDVIARLPGCDGQAVDAESACTEAKMEDAPDCSEFQNRNVQMFGSVFRDVDDPSHGQTLMVQWFLPNEICMYAHSQDCGGKTVRRNSVGTWMGVSTELRMCSSKTRIILVSICG